jgi:hypothetical protein
LVKLWLSSWPSWPTSIRFEDGQITEDGHEDGQLTIFRTTSIHKGFDDVGQDGQLCMGAVAKIKPPLTTIMGDV